ncbi:hypothetical protein BKA70DRAFT_1235902 [Coprinopsis sp. MPI-PUGE-AT-0042]|nr:hypothetical protein BKA70DRAFT_1235902 [Coprinopsis sp. MPI-PUGE-AT-0042]
MALAGRRRTDRLVAPNPGNGSSTAAIRETMLKNEFHVKHGRKMRQDHWCIQDTLGLNVGGLFDLGYFRPIFLFSMCTLTGSTILVPPPTPAVIACWLKVQRGKPMGMVPRLRPPTRSRRLHSAPGNGLASRPSSHLHLLPAPSSSRVLFSVKVIALKVCKGFTNLTVDLIQGVQWAIPLATHSPMFGEWATHEDTSWALETQTLARKRPSYAPSGTNAERIGGPGVEWVAWYEFKETEDLGHVHSTSHFWWKDTDNEPGRRLRVHHLSQLGPEQSKISAGVYPFGKFVNYPQSRREACGLRPSRSRMEGLKMDEGISRVFGYRYADGDPRACGGSTRGMQRREEEEVVEAHMC